MLQKIAYLQEMFGMKTVQKCDAPLSQQLSAQQQNISVLTQNGSYNLSWMQIHGTIIPYNQRYSQSKHIQFSERKGSQIIIQQSAEEEGENYKIRRSSCY